MLLSAGPRGSAHRGAMGSVQPHFEVAGRSERGAVRQRNDDYFAYYIPGDPERLAQDGALFVIADGVGSGPAGNAASAEATNVLLQEYYFSRRDAAPGARLRAAFERVSSHIFALASENRGFHNMQTTLTSLLVRGDGWWCCHVGDSKLFSIRASHPRQVTRDHSLVREMVRWSILGQKDAEQHPARHVLTKSLGVDPVVRPDSCGGRWSEGDIFLLSTDGLLEHVTVEELAGWLSTEGIRAGVDHGVDVGNTRGGTDNLTLLGVRLRVETAEA